MIELIIFSILGVLIGIITGLVPGLHVNTILPIIISLVFIDPYSLAVFVVSIAITQVFVGFIPSIFIGAPEEDTALSVLPGHRLLFEGRGYEAIKLTVIGGICSLFVTILSIYFLANYFQILYQVSRPYIQYLIGSIVLFMLFSEKKFRKILLATSIVLISGLLGILTLSSSIVPQTKVLFPVLTGLFGLSTLIVSMSQKSKIPDQSEEDELKISKLDILKSVILGSFAGISVGFLPAIGVSQAATIVQQVGGMGEARSFLVTLSSINVANEIFSLISLFLVGNPRSGASVAIEKILQELTAYDVLLLIGTICLASGIAAIATLFLGSKIPKILVKLNYKYLSLVVIFFITSMVAIVTGLMGLLVLFASVSIGILCNNLGVRRSHCMGVLLIPSILFFSGLNPLIISMLRL